MNEPITTVSVCFQADLRKDNPRTYTYRVPTSLTPKLRDLAIVFVRERFECVSIIGINPPLDPNAKFEYKFILDIFENHLVTKRSELHGLDLYDFDKEHQDDAASQ